MLFRCETPACVVFGVELWCAELCGEGLRAVSQKEERVLCLFVKLSLRIHSVNLVFAREILGRIWALTGRGATAVRHRQIRRLVESWFCCSEIWRTPRFISCSFG